MKASVCALSAPLIRRVIARCMSNVHWFELAKIQNGVKFVFAFKSILMCRCLGNALELYIETCFQTVVKIKNGDISWKSSIHVEKVGVLCFRINKHGRFVLHVGTSTNPTNTIS